MRSINNHIMRTKCPNGMKQTALEREFLKFSLKCQKSNFDFCPVLPAFGIMPHIF